MHYEIDISALQRLEAQRRQAPAIVRQELQAAVLEADLLLEREVIEDMMDPQHKASGMLAGSTFHEEQVGDTSFAGLVATPLSYAVPVELGSRPHFPPIEPLIDWVQVKLSITDEREARGAAFLIARKIARVGTPAKRHFGRTFQAQERQVGEIFDRAAARIASRIAGAG